MTRLKYCPICEQEKPLEDFAVKSWATMARVSHCRVCKRAYNQQWYIRNRERHMAMVAVNNARYTARARDFINKAKDLPCARCGGYFPPVCMDFDHVRGEKVTEIADMGSNGASESQLREEIAKCEVVCANCHRLRTWERGQSSNRRARDAAPAVVSSTSEFRQTRDPLPDHLTLWGLESEAERDGGQA